MPFGWFALKSDFLFYARDWGFQSEPTLQESRSLWFLSNLSDFLNSQRWGVECFLKPNHRNLAF
jgi:hypothetical protein